MIFELLAHAHVRVWDSATGEVLVVLEGHSGGVKSVVFGPHGATIVSGSEDSTIR